MLLHLLYYLLGFVLIWVGAGLAVKDIDRLSRKLHFSSFAVSFLFLGFFTSISEISVGINALVERDPEIYVGNLIGGSIVLFLLVIPLLAVAGNGLKMVHSLQQRHLAVVLFTIAAPVFLVFDNVVSLADAAIFIILYVYLFKTLHEERGIRNFLASLVAFRETAMLKILGKVALGVGMVLMASRLIVNETLYFASAWHVSPFIISLLVISIGTNVPELSIAVRSLYLGKREVALGNYLGSAAFNTLTMGMLTIANGGKVTMVQSFTLPLIFLVVGLILFYRFGKSGSRITRNEGWQLIALYAAFLVTEIVRGGIR